MIILCVDDDRTTLTLVTRSLEKICPEDTVLGASSGEEAVQTIGSTPVDLIITDLVMPGLGGIDVLEAAKKARADTEIIMKPSHRGGSMIRRLSGGEVCSEGTIRHGSVSGPSVPTMIRRLVIPRDLNMSRSRRRRSRFPPSPAEPRFIPYQ